MKKFKIRCSSIGKIMGNLEPLTEKQIELMNNLNVKEKRTEKQEETLQELKLKLNTPTDLSQTAKSYCEMWLKQQLYSRRKNIKSKYMDKGLIMEDNSIDFIADYLNLGMLIKNEVRMSNDYMEGECDVLLPKDIFDAKNSWDCFTFPLFDKEIPNIDYYWQGQGYMELYNRDSYKLIYVLSDTPAHIIRREAYFYAINNGYDELSKEIHQEFIDNMTYPDIIDNLKIKIFPFTRNNNDIKKIKGQVIKCREYINNLIKTNNINK